MNRLTRAALAAAVAAAALPSAAHATTVSITAGGELTVAADLFQVRNNVVVFPRGDRIAVFDSGEDVEPATGSPCITQTRHEVSCPAAAVRSVRVRTLSQPDSFRDETGLPTVYEAGDGDDVWNHGFGFAPSRVTFNGGPGFDAAAYGGAVTAVAVAKDGVANDGRAGDRDNVGTDVEQLFGSSKSDLLIGSATGTTPEVFSGGAGDDEIHGGAGTDEFRTGNADDGADAYFGGGGHDLISYERRTNAVRLTLSDGGADDGEAGEHDELREIEQAEGGAGADLLGAHPASSVRVVLSGGPGADRITGTERDDFLGGGAGRDILFARGGADLIGALDGEADTIDCGGGADTAQLDRSGDTATSCETAQVGRLRLADRSLRGAAGRVVPVRLSWRHPEAWRNLREVELRLLRGAAPVGRVTIRAGSGRIRAAGAVRVAGRAGALRREGRTVRARLALRLDPALAGQTLALEVEATDRSGRRQLERGAGTLRVAE